MLVDSNSDLNMLHVQSQAELQLRDLTVLLPHSVVGSTLL